MTGSGFACEWVQGDQCKFLVIFQAFRGTPPRRRPLPRRRPRQRGGGAPLPPHRAPRGCEGGPQRLLGADATGDGRRGHDFSKATPRCTLRRATATQRSAGCCWRPVWRSRRRRRGLGAKFVGALGSAFRGPPWHCGGPGETPLHLAAASGYTEAVKALLKAKASVASTNIGGRGLGAKFVLHRL